MEINKFELIKDGFFGGGLGSEKKPYGPLVFSGGKITINQVDDAIHISLDENTETNIGFNTEEIMRGFNQIHYEDFMMKTKSRYRIKVYQPIDFLNQDQLFSVRNVIDGKTLVLVPTVE